MTDGPNLVAVSSLDALYTAAPEEFVAARNALAKELKAAGDKATATEITKLRRPPVSAWALNQVAREHPDEITELLDAATALAAALAAPADFDLRAAQRTFRSTIESVVRAAQAVVTDRGRTPSATFQQAVQATLQAAAVDDDIAATVRAGILAEDEPAPGFLIGAGTPAPREPKPAKKAPATRPTLKAVPSKAAPAEPKPTAAERAAERAAAKEAAREEARAEAEQREADRRRRARLAELRTEVQRLERRAERLNGAADKAEANAIEARAEATEAQTEVDAMLAALEAAEQADD